MPQVRALGPGSAPPPSSALRNAPLCLDGDQGLEGSVPHTHVTVQTEVGPQQAPATASMQQHSGRCRWALCSMLPQHSILDW